MTRANPKLIGAFVVGAVLVLVAAVLWISSGRMFAERTYYSVFFPGSVQGLKVGAPITFRGVPIGKVVEVTAFFTGRDIDIEVEVVLELEDGKIQDPTNLQRRFNELSDAESAAFLIEKGIRATLRSGSLITGSKFVSLEFHPDSEVRLGDLTTRYPQLPTMPTGMELMSGRLNEILNEISKMPVKELIDDVRVTFDSASGLLESEDLKGAIAGLNKTMKMLEGTLDALEETARQAGKTLDDVDDHVIEAAEELRATLKQADATLRQAGETLETVGVNVERSSEVQLQVTRTLMQLEDAVETMRSLVDYLERHPEALIKGKQNAREE